MKQWFLENRAKIGSLMLFVFTTTMIYIKENPSILGESETALWIFGLLSALTFGAGAARSDKYYIDKRNR